MGTKACVIRPKKGTDTFDKLKLNFGHQIAAEVFNRIVTDEFIDRFQDSITLDSDGIPTYSSIMSNKLVKEYIGEENILKALNKNNITMPNTLENTNILIYRADKFNTENKEHVAIVDYVDLDTLTIKILPKTTENENIAKYQLAILNLNNTIVELLSSAGITIGHISSIETAIGKVGEVNFNHAKNIANEFAGLIRVANDFEGSVALSEEFSHLLAGIYKDNPLMLRALNYLKDPDKAELVLGDKFDDYLEEYLGDMDAIAEEALGHMLRELFLNVTTSTKVPLFERVKNFITKMFRGISPRKYQDSIDLIKYDLNKFAKDILTNKTTITKELIQQSARDARFNALTNLVETQIEAVKNIANRLHRESSFVLNTQDNKEKSNKKKTAIETTGIVNKSIREKESMAAIAELLNVSQKEVQDIYIKLGKLDEVDTKDRFTILRNALYALQSNGETINELYSILSEEFMQDPIIASQHFMIQETEDILKDYRTNEPLDPIDTSNKTNEEIANIIVLNSKDIILSDDKTHYINIKTGAKYMRATEVILAYFEGHTFDPDSPWVKPSTNIGTGIDELVRDFIQGRITYNSVTSNWEVEGETLENVYPNATREDLNAFVAQLRSLQKNIIDLGITLIPRDVTVEGVVDATDNKGNVHKIQVAGTLDLLGYDSNGNWYIYDMKTHRSNLDQDTQDKYARQLSLYKKLLEDKYGIKIKNLSIIPIKVNYPAPFGTESGTAKYTVKNEKPDKYNGKEGNQLMKDGEEFKGAHPYQEPLIDLEEKGPNIDYRKLAKDPTGGFGNAKNYIFHALANLNSLYKSLENRFYEQSLKEFVAFLIPFIGETIEISDGKGGLKTVPIEEVVKKTGRDLSIMQRYFTTMADNPDSLLKIFDKIVKIQKGKLRFNTIEMSLKILALGKEFESKGVTEYSWMFEKDNQRYINKLIINGLNYSYDRAAYENAKKIYIESLDKLYGKHPQIGSKEYNEKKKALRLWIYNNTEKVVIDDVRTTIPKHTLYPSKWNSLSTAKKEFYDRWMALKEELDSVLPDNATTLTNTIKIRKKGSERFVNLIKKGDFQGIIEEAKSSYMRSFDDSYNYKGLVGLNGEEAMTLPLYYLHSSDNSDLTHDVIGSLIAYADMAYYYQAMQDVINPLEIGRNWVMENRKIPITKGKRTLLGKNKAGKETITSQGHINPKSSKFGELLDDFFESKIYEKYLIDYGEIAGVDVNKAAGLVLKLGSAIQLGFNELAHMANVGTGIAMHNIEAAAGQYFNARELARADKEFFSALPEYLGDIGQRIAHSKLALSNELFDVRLDFRKKQKNKDFLNKIIIGRIFGPRLLFLGQDIGDFWLYNRTFIAMAIRYKLRDKNNNPISLWDALITVPINKNHPEYGSKLVIKEGITKEDGSEFTKSDIDNFSRKVGALNRHLFGIYNDEDSLAARRHLWGRFGLQYRDWLPSLMRYRFGSLTIDPDSGEKFEGYYTTSAKFAWGLRKELINGLKSLPLIWDELEDYLKANIKRAIAEILLLMIVNILCYALTTKSKDKDRAWINRTLRALLLRERTELGALSYQMPREMVNILKSPIAAANPIQDIVNLTTLLNPVKYTDEIQSGDYKDHSSAYKAFMESPLTLWYRNLKKLQHPERMEHYYENLE